MEEDSTADMQFARRTPGRFSAGDGSAGTEKRERLTASPRRLAPRDPGSPAPCAAEVRAGAELSPLPRGRPARSRDPIPRSVRISNAEAYSSVFTKSASALASSAETPLKAFLCGGFLESLPLVSRSGPARRSGWSLSAPRRPGPVLPGRDNRRTWFYGSLFRPARTQAKSKTRRE